METAIRWASSSTISEQSFLLVDVNGRTFRHCQVGSYDEHDLQYDVLTTHRKVPPFRAFDWSYNETLIAVGQWSGEATILRLDDESQTLSLPIKHQRLCNAVAFGPGGLLATGLERVRNDFCLNVWDSTRGAASVSTPASPRPGSGKQTIEPIRKLASSEGITSIKFFPQPDTLVAGVKGTCIRIYDLRENTGNPAVQVQTGCVHNIAIDGLDENYFASAAPAKDSTIQIWDRRAGSSSSQSLIGNSLGHNTHHGPALEFRQPFDRPHDATQATVWSLKFCKSQRGCLGALASTGDCKIFQIQKQYTPRADVFMDRHGYSSDDDKSYAEPVSMKRILQIGHTPRVSKRGADEDSRVVSFDFTNLGGRQGRPCAITQSSDQAISIREIESPRSVLSASSTGVLAIGRKLSTSSNKISTGNRPQLISQINLVYPSEAGSTAQSSQHIRARMPKPERRLPLNKTHISSREAHEKVHAPQKLDSLDDALSSSTLLRHRCIEGYLFSCTRNAEIVSDDPWLQAMWTWVGRAKGNAADGGMLAGATDLGFLGVSAIWNSDLGSQKVSRMLEKGLTSGNLTDAVVSLVKGLQLPNIKHENTDYPYHRQLCLHTCGLALSNQRLEPVLTELCEKGHNTNAALLAVAHEEYKLASNALRTGNPESAHLSIALAGFVKDNSNEIWNETMRELAKELDDPHARAILAFVSNGDWHDVLNITSLPLKDRVMVALLHLDDQELTEYIKSTQNECIRQGDIEGIVLTGLSEDAVPLFEAYMLKFADLQTPILALSFTSPRYFVNPLVDMWREAYRSQLNTHRLFLQRTQFDVQATKLSVHPGKSNKPLLAPAPRQVSLQCNHCDQALDRNPDHMPVNNPDPTAFSSSQRTSIFGDVKSGTVCPKCGRHMPRCVVCMMWLGMPESHGKGGTVTAVSARQSGIKTSRSPDPKSDKIQRQEKPIDQRGAQVAQNLMKDFIAVCKACWHMSHGSHAMEWFKEHDACPVPGCDCRCSLLDNGP